MDGMAIRTLYSKLTHAEGAVVTLIEFTFLAKCIRGTDRIIAMSENMKFKALAYVIFAVALWCSLIQSGSGLIVPAITLSLSGLAYGGAVVRGEEHAKSNVVTQEGIARTFFKKLKMLAAKKAFRKEMKAVLKKVPQQVIDLESKSITMKLLSHPVYLAAKSVSVFLNMPGEVETIGILQDIFARGKDCFVPMCSEKMDMVQLKSMDDFNSLQKNSWGIPEPLPAENRLNVEEYKEGLHLVIMPGLAFDKQGSRIGYGKGYYDKFLSRSFDLASQKGLPKPNTIAICLSAQMVDLVPTADYDIKPDFIITP
ncbi:DnaJ sub C member 10 [Boothiomyces sp. JEL0866]|nr:DnaJ sub C member 10 [Boothiomyces sp. JEL0866]